MLPLGWLVSPGSVWAEELAERPVRDDALDDRRG